VRGSTARGEHEAVAGAARQPISGGRRDAARVEARRRPAAANGLPPLAVGACIWAACSKLTADAGDHAESECAVLLCRPALSLPAPLPRISSLLHPVLGSRLRLQRRG